jgi:hypothetical protein
MNTKNSTIKIANEDAFDLNAPIVDVLVGNQEISDCTAYLRVDGNVIEDIFSPAGLIRYDAFESLYTKARLMHTTGNYAAGLKIYFGIDSATNKICLFYQPVCLENGQNASPGYRQYDVIEGEWFSYDAGQNIFVLKNTNDVTPFLNNHKERISIRRIDTDSTPTRFIPNTDVEAVIFPFQQIKALMNDNPERTHVGFYNAIRKEEGITARIRHTLLLYATTTGAAGTAPMKRAAIAELPGYSEKYANLANLCPPNGTALCKIINS